MKLNFKTLNYVSCILTRVYNDASLSYAMPYVGSNLQPEEAKSIFELDTNRPYDSFDDSFRGKSGIIILMDR